MIALEKCTKLKRGFYERDTLDVAKDLLGKYLVHVVDGQPLVGQIIETEAYKENDKGAHFYSGRRTQRTEVAFHEGGYAYIYLIYGMYYCFNVVTEPKGTPGAVLVRAMKPILGLEQMMKNRKKDKLDSLADGPGKICIALNITKNQNGLDLLENEIYIAENDESKRNFEIKAGKRINIDYAEECKDYLWRFYI